MTLRNKDDVFGIIIRLGLCVGGIPGCEASPTYRLLGHTGFETFAEQAETFEPRVISQMQQPRSNYPGHAKPKSTRTVSVHMKPTMSAAVLIYDIAIEITHKEPEAKVAQKTGTNLEPNDKQETAASTPEPKPSRIRQLLGRATGNWK